MTREKIVPVRLNDKELEQIKKRAQRLEKSVSGYLRLVGKNCVCFSPMKIPDLREEHIAELEKTPEEKSDLRINNEINKLKKSQNEI